MKELGNGMGRLVAPLLAGVLAAAVLLGAGGNAGAQGVELKVLTLYSPGSPTAIVPDLASFRLQGDTVAAAATALKRAVEARFPHITLTFVDPRIVEEPVNAEALALELLTGGYDLVVSDVMASLIPYDVLMPLDRFLEHEPIRSSAQYESLLRQMTWEGRLYDLPLAIDPFLLLYVPRIFDEVGLAYPDAQWTWSDFARAAERLYFEEDPGILPFSRAPVSGVTIPLFGARIHPGALLPVLLSQLNRTGLEDEDEALNRALSFLMELYQNPGVFWTITHPPAPLALGRAAMEPAYIGQGIRHATAYTGWWPQRVVDQVRWVSNRIPGTPAPFAWGIAPLPTFEGEEPLTEAAVLSVAIPVSSRNSAAAWQVARFIASAEGAAIVARTGLLSAYVNEEILSHWLPALQGRGVDPPDASTVISALRVTVAGRRHGVAEYQFRSMYPARILGLFEGRYWLFDALDIAREVRAEIAALGLEF